MPNFIRRSTRFLSLVWLILISGIEVPPVSAADPRSGVLTLATDDHLAGSLGPASAKGLLAWQGSDFVRPFEFEFAAIASLRFPNVEPRPQPVGLFGIELLNGDVLTGDIVGWQAEQVTVQSAHFREVQLQSRSIRRLYRLSENPLVSLAGLTGLTGWETNDKPWKESGAGIETEQPLAVAVSNVDLPDTAIVEFELHWEGKPNFVLAIGCDADAKGDKPGDGFRFEVWGDELAIVRETPQLADVNSIQKLHAGLKSVQLTAYLNQATGELHVYHAGGTPAASVTVKPGEGRKRGEAIRLVNLAGKLRLERLRVAQWNGVLPTGEANSEHTQLAGGQAVAGRIVGMSEDRQAFLLQDGDVERQAPVADLLSAEIASGADAVRDPATVILQDGTRVSGQLDATTAGELIVEHRNLSEKLRIPVESVRSVTIYRGPEDGQADEQPGSRIGRLQLNGLSLLGSLNPHAEADGEHCLSFQPKGSRTASPLRPDASGSLTYRETTRPARAASSSPRTLEQVQPAAPTIFNLFSRKPKEPAQPPQVPTAHNLHLKSGDVIPCQVTLIDEEGLTITSTVATANLVPHEFVKAVEFNTRAKAPELDEAKRTRLLTLPRLQKDSPPTHILCATNGDFLRCRMIGLEGENLRVELKLEEIEIPVKLVSQIIWLHPEDSLAVAANADAAAANAAVDPGVIGDAANSVTSASADPASNSTESASAAAAEGASPAGGAGGGRHAHLVQAIEPQRQPHHVRPAGASMGPRSRVRAPFWVIARSI
ncbi:MAG: hypothetical protein R3B90_20860 [Planctomycetaceae bacterium]